jgi:transcriptional regulator with XRE-family HTH domain
VYKGRIKNFCFLSSDVVELRKVLEDKSWTLQGENKMVQKGLNTRLREARTKKGFSQQYVADMLCISRQSISNWEAGRGYPDLDNVVLLSNLYEVSLDWILKEEKPEEVVKEIETGTISEKQKETKDRIFQEILTILLVFALSCHLPFLGACAAIVVAIWMKKSERKYKCMYVACVCALIANLYNTYSILLYFFDYGISTIEKISSL